MQGSITSIEDSLKTANLNITLNQEHAEKVLECSDDNNNSARMVPLVYFYLRFVLYHTIIFKSLRIKCIFFSE